MAPTIEFKFRSSDSLDAAFDRIRWGQRFEWGRNFMRFSKMPSHMEPLLVLADDFEVSDDELDNALNLASGYGRMLVVLLEPADEEDIAWEDICDAPKTIQEIDELLLEASSPQWLDAAKTCIFDVRPLRPRWKQRADEDFHPSFERSNNNAAYACFEEMVMKLKPDVIVVCQCGTATVSNETARLLSSNMVRAGTTEMLSIGGKDTRIVYGFHPSQYMVDEYLEDFVQRRPGAANDLKTRKYLLRALLRLTFHIAINALGGRDVHGSGIDALRKAALGEIRERVPRQYARFGPADVMTESLRPMRRDVASDELIRELDILETA